MLININKLLSPEILSLLRSMGHGDRFVLSDANFPSYSHAAKLYRMDGLTIPEAAAAILTPPDPITQIGLAIPLLILYELSIFSVKFIENKNLEKTDA